MLVQKLLEQERRKAESMKTARRKLLHECRILHSQFQECNIYLLAEDEDDFNLESTSLQDALDLLSSCDDRIASLLTEVKIVTRH